MKIILTEQQLRKLINENTFTSNITVDDVKLTSGLEKLKNDGFNPKSNIHNIFNYMNNLPKGDYFIVDAEASTIDEVENDLLALLNDSKSKSSETKPPQFFLYKHIPAKHNNPEKYIGIGIMLTQVGVKSSRETEAGTTPMGSHGGK